MGLTARAAAADPTATDWRHFPSSAADPTAWMEGRIAADLPTARRAASPPLRGGGGRRRRTSLFEYIAPAFPAFLAARGSRESVAVAGSADSTSPIWRAAATPHADRLEGRVRALLGLPASGPLNRPPDIRIRRFRRGERVRAYGGTGGGGRPLLLVLHGAAVVAAGGSVVDRVGPGGCIGGAQYVLQASPRRPPRCDGNHLSCRSWSHCHGNSLI